MYSVPYIVGETRDEFFWEAIRNLNSSVQRVQINEDWFSASPPALLLPAPSDRAARVLREEYYGGRTLRNTREDREDLGNLYRDGIIGFGAHRLANLMAYNNKQPTYYYQFEYIGNQSHYEDPDTGEPVGVAHQDELIYLFSLPAIFNEIPLSDSRDSLMVDKLTTILYNFALTGNPNPLLDTNTRWPPIKPNQRTYLRIGDDFSLGENLLEDRYSIWERLYPIEYNLTRCGG